MKKYNKMICELVKLIFVALFLFLMEFLLRLQPEMKEQHITIWDEVPALFNLAYIGIILCLIYLVGEILCCHNQLIEKILYGIIYSCFGFYFIAEAVYCKIFGRIFSIKEIVYAKEGAKYIGVAIQHLDIGIIIYIISVILFGIIGWKIFPDFSVFQIRKKNLVILTMFSILGFMIYIIPFLFKSYEDMDDWNSKRVIFEKWSHNKRAAVMFGGYEFVVRDIYLTVKSKQISEDGLKQIEEYLGNFSSEENVMSSCFEGKNLIFVLLESMDDWLITEQETPTLYKMMNESLNFTNMYTPMFGTGYTLNTEFASYTGLYASSDGTSLVNYANNEFTQGLPFLFREKGYKTSAYHYNSGEFYNRFNMHHSVGFEKYVSYMDYVEEENAEIDSVLVECDMIYNQFIENTPFFNYLITYSAHGKAGVLSPYSYDDVAFEVHPEYIGKYETEEIDSIHAKAKLTDEMFEKLLLRLEEDGVLEDTVIIGITDHYAYCLNDKEYLKKASGVDNEYELSRNPFFIWSTDIEAQQIDKICNTLDVYPTVCNMFGLTPDYGSLGNDIFDENYEGFAYWPDGSWITSEGAFFSNTNEIRGNLTEEKISQMNEKVSSLIQVNNDILESDYYSTK